MATKEQIEILSKSILKYHLGGVALQEEHDEAKKIVKNIVLNKHTIEDLVLIAPLSLTDIETENIFLIALKKKIRNLPRSKVQEIYLNIIAPFSSVQLFLRGLVDS